MLWTRWPAKRTVRVVEAGPRLLHDPVRADHAIFAYRFSICFSNHHYENRLSNAIKDLCCTREPPSTPFVRSPSSNRVGIDEYTGEYFIYYFIRLAGIVVESDRDNPNV